MLYTLESKNYSLSGYYTDETPESISSIPSDIDLVYWDYYHVRLSVNSLIRRMLIRTSKRLRSTELAGLILGSLVVFGVGIEFIRPLILRLKLRLRVYKRARVKRLKTFS